MPAVGLLLCARGQCLAEAPPLHAAPSSAGQLHNTIVLPNQCVALAMASASVSPYAHAKYVKGLFPLHNCRAHAKKEAMEMYDEQHGNDPDMQQQ